MDVRDVVESTCEAAFAEDSSGSIVAWNEAAEELLGFRRREVLDRKCWEVLRGRDVYGNRYCGEHCPLRDHAFLGEPVHTAPMFFQRAGGEVIQVVNCCMLAGEGSRSQSCLVHILTVPGSNEDVEVAAVPRPVSAHRARLTLRQQEVLRLLAEGRGTGEISELLSISVSTTRNHIQGILARLGVHSRLEATIVARRDGLL